MLILTQSKNELINFDNVCHIWIEENALLAEITKTYSSPIFLGSFDSKEIARTVFDIVMYSAQNEYKDKILVKIPKSDGNPVEEE